MDSVRIRAGGASTGADASTGCQTGAMSAGGRAASQGGRPARPAGDRAGGDRGSGRGTGGERVVVAWSGGPEGDPLLRRGAEVLERSGGGHLLAVHVVSPDGPRDSEPGLPAGRRELVERFGGTDHQVIGQDVAGAILAFARSAGATQLVVGTSRRGRIARLIGGPGVASQVVRAAGPLDVHVVDRPRAEERPRLPRLRGALSWRRRLGGLVLALIACPLLTWGLTAVRSTETLTTSALSYQLLVVVVSLVGGVWPALLAAVASGLALDYFLIPPFRAVSISDPVHTLAVALFVLVALLVSYVVDRSARRARIARRATAESDLLSTVAGSVLREQDALHAMVSTTREAFGLTAVRLVRMPADNRALAGGGPGARRGTRAPMEDEGGAPAPSDRAGSRFAAAGDDHRRAAPVVLAADGDPGAPGRRRAVPVDDRTTLELTGPELDASEQRLLGVVATQIRATLEHRDLEDRAREVGALEASDRVRSALLSAVGHDVRRPLAAATAAVSGLETMQDRLSPADREELLAVAAKGLADLTALVTDLLDISRVQAGVFPVVTQPTDPVDALLPAMEELGLGPGDVDLDLAPDLPPVQADAALLRRILVNLLANARRFTSPGSPVLLTAGTGGATGGSVEIRVVDHGPGLPADRRDEIFTPFQRLGDTDNTTGLGLGLALSRGFAEGMGGSLRAEDTPGGGLTMVVSLPGAGAPSSPGRAGPPLSAAPPSPPPAGPPSPSAPRPPGEARGSLPTGKERS